jgi:uncharacterized protein YegL
MRFNSLLAACLLLLTTAVTASTDGDLLTKQIAAMPKDNPAMLLDVLNNLCGKARVCKNVGDRRQFQMLINDLEDALGKLKNPDALKIVANILPRLPVETQISACFGLRGAPFNADVDAVVLKMLDRNADNRLKVAVMDLLAAHRITAAVEKIAPFLAADQFPSVQIAACRALAFLPDKRGIPPLLKYMESLKGGNGRYIHEAAAALRSLTGQKLEDTVPAWSKWWAANEKTFAIDPAAVLEPKFDTELGSPSDLTYYDIPVVENRMVFVLDMSGSMSFGGKPNRLEQCKAELKKIIARLRQNQEFNVVAFASGSTRWQRRMPLVPANEQMKAEAIKFIENLAPKGGTQTADVLEEVIRDIASVYGLECVYLVTDGNPNPWVNGITNAMQARHITWFNQPYKVRINTIGIFTVTDAEKRGWARDEDVETMKQFLYALATCNDGLYKEIGK